MAQNHDYFAIIVVVRVSNCNGAQMKATRAPEGMWHMSVLGKKYNLQTAARHDLELRQQSKG
jgi:hypothetical protein